MIILIVGLMIVGYILSKKFTDTETKNNMSYLLKYLTIVVVLFLAYAFIRYK